MLETVCVTVTSQRGQRFYRPWESGFGSKVCSLHLVDTVSVSFMLFYSAEVGGL